MFTQSAFFLAYGLLRWSAKPSVFQSRDVVDRRGWSSVSSSVTDEGGYKYLAGHIGLSLLMTLYDEWT